MAVRPSEEPGQSQFTSTLVYMGAYPASAANRESERDGVGSHGERVRALSSRVD